jgi:hypothetical protein
MNAEQVFAAAVRDVRARHGDLFPAATVQHFAWARWMALLARHPEAVTDPRFVAEGEEVCRFFLLDEVLLHQQVRVPQRAHPSTGS